MLATLMLFISKVFFVLAALLPIMNPPGMVPIFLAQTARNTEAQRNYLARRIAISSFVLLLGSMYIGSYVLEFFGVSLPVVQLSGGLLITFSAWRLLNDTPADASPASMQTGEHISKEELKQRAFYPLAFPLTVGPGSVSVAITLGASMTQAGHGILKYTLAPAASLVGVALVSFFVFWCYRHGEKLTRILGATGELIFMRLTAFILLCLGVQIMWDGFSQLLGELIKAHA
ncbi:MarC family protein [Craterilacuibacter sp.]|uniref:MarC family protein n=1 Tax=Craterilacuibacter sp. TaxID=2870909 RepID=UPI003F413798